MKPFVAIVGLAIAAGCGAPSAPTTLPESEPRWASLGRACTADAPAASLSADARESVAPRSPEWDVNARWAALARRVPGGWGGFFLEDGVPTIYLVDPALKETAIAVLAAEGFPLGSTTRVKQGRWDFAQLYDWYRYLAPHTSVADGMSFSDIQEARNRIEYGVIDEGARTRLEEILARLDLPCFLVAIQIRPRAEFR